MSREAAPLVVEESDGVATLTLHRPHRLNAIDGDIATALEEVLPRLHEDPRIRAIVLGGSGRAFCAGSDVHQMLERPDRSTLDEPERSLARATERARLARAFENLVRLYELPKPTIAALHGAVAGAGLALALACDARVASEDAILLASYGKLGLPGDWAITALLPEVAGPNIARAMLLRGRPLEAREALAVGLVDEVVPPDDLDARTSQLATELAAGPTRAYGEAKRLLRRVDVRGAIAAEIDATLRCQETRDHGAALRAFAVGQAPVFEGR